MPVKELIETIISDAERILSEQGNVGRLLK